MGASQAKPSQPVQRVTVENPLIPTKPPPTTTTLTPMQGATAPALQANQARSQAEKGQLPPGPQATYITVRPPGAPAGPSTGGRRRRGRKSRRRQSKKRSRKHR